MALLSRRRRDDLPLWRPDEFLGFGDLLERFFEPSRWTAGTWLPAMDIADRDDAIVVRAEVPGMKAEDIEVTVQGNTLTLRGEKKEDFEEKDKTSYRTERRYGTFYREVLLPSDVDGDKVQATCHDGVLTVTLPKVAAAKSRKIQVKTD
jgi:HSP20 family protein